MKIDIEFSEAELSVWELETEKAGLNSVEEFVTQKIRRVSDIFLDRADKHVAEKFLTAYKNATPEEKATVAAALRL